MKKVIKISLAITVPLLIIAGLIYISIFGYVGYWRAYIACGNKPVLISPVAIGAEIYRYEPAEEYDILHPSMFAKDYYCTEQEAINAGYKPMFNPNGSFNND